MGGTFALMASISMAQAEKLVISNWDGYMPKDIAEKFKAETGIDLEVAVHATNEEIMGKVTASGGEGFDVLFVSSPFAEALNKLQLLSPIDHGKIPNMANLYAEAGQLKHDPGNTFSVPYAWGTTGLCYRSDLVKAEPTSWNDLLKPTDDLKGKITMLAGGDKDLFDLHHKAMQAMGDRIFNMGPSIPSWCPARRPWFMPGTAGATTASPKTPRSSTWCPRKAQTSGSTPW